MKIKYTGRYTPSEIIKRSIHWLIGLLEIDIDLNYYESEISLLKLFFIPFKLLILPFILALETLIILENIKIVIKKDEQIKCDICENFKTNFNKDIMVCLDCIEKYHIETGEDIERILEIKKKLKKKKLLEENENENEKRNQVQTK